MLVCFYCGGKQILKLFAAKAFAVTQLGRLRDIGLRVYALINGMQSCTMPQNTATYGYVAEASTFISLDRRMQHYTRSKCIEKSATLYDMRRTYIYSRLSITNTGGSRHTCHCASCRSLTVSRLASASTASS
jgi:hypothetical protein